MNTYMYNIHIGKFFCPVFGSGKGSLSLHHFLHPKVHSVKLRSVKTDPENGMFGRLSPFHLVAPKKAYFQKEKIAGAAIFSGSTSWVFFVQTNRSTHCKLSNGKTVQV